MSGQPFDLAATDIPAPWQARFYDQLGSTSDEALALVRAGEITAPTVVLTGEQTAGRGRGRGAGTWTSSRGNLAISFVHFPDAPIRDWPALSYAAGLVLAQSLTEVCGFPDEAVRLKWPNDVFVGEGKVAGLLLETVAAPGGRQALVLGMGLNIEQAPELDRADYVARSLRELGYQGPAQDVVLNLMDQWAATTAQFDQSSGPRARLFRDWQAKALYLGETIGVRIDSEQRIQGQFIGLDDQSGALLLRLPTGEVRTIMAGDVVLATASSS